MSLEHLMGYLRMEALVKEEATVKANIEEGHFFSGCSLSISFPFFCGTTACDQCFLRIYMIMVAFSKPFTFVMIITCTFTDGLPKNDRYFELKITQQFIPYGI